MDSRRLDKMSSYRWRREGLERLARARVVPGRDRARDEREPCRVLIVEDDPLVREALQLLLEGKRHEAIAVGDGRTILEILEGYRPAMIILDVHLPGPDGFSVCETVRSSSAFRDIPVLFLTARSDDASFIRCLNVNGSAYLTKPFQPQELLETIERLTLEQRHE